MLSWSVDISNSGSGVSGLSIDPIKAEQWPLENNPPIITSPTRSQTNNVWLFRLCAEDGGGKYIWWYWLTLRGSQRIHWRAARRAAPPQASEENIDHKYKTLAFHRLQSLKSIASGAKQACGSEKKNTAGKLHEGKRHVGLVRRRGAFGQDDDEHSSFFLFFFLFLCSVSCIDCGNRERMSWLQGRVQGFFFFFLFFFAQCEEKRPKGMFGLGVFKQGMSENSTMEH